MSSAPDLHLTGRAQNRAKSAGANAVKRRMSIEGKKRRTKPAEDGERWEEVARRLPLGERLPNPEIVTEEDPEMIEPSEGDGA